MDLNTIIGMAIQQTNALHALLTEDDLGTCAALLTLRGKTMQEFERIHLAADHDTISANADQIAELYRTDQELQTAFQQMRDVTAHKWQEVVGQSPVPHHAYHRSGAVGCLDRTV